MSDSVNFLQKGIERLVKLLTNAWPIVFFFLILYQCSILNLKMQILAGFVLFG